MATKIEAVTATVSGNVPYTLLISAPEEFLYGQRGGLVHISQLRWRHSPAYDGGRSGKRLRWSAGRCKAGRPVWLRLLLIFGLQCFGKIRPRSIRAQSCSL